MVTFLSVCLPLSTTFNYVYKTCVFYLCHVLSMYDFFVIKHFSFTVSFYFKYFYVYSTDVNNILIILSMFCQSLKNAEFCNSEFQWCPT